jgi:hypothetical protein
MEKQHLTPDLLNWQSVIRVQIRFIKTAIKGRQNQIEIETLKNFWRQYKNEINAYSKAKT